METTLATAAPARPQPRVGLFPVIVGTLTLAEPTEVHRDRTYPWWVHVLVPAGRYPVVAHERSTSTFAAHTTGVVLAGAATNGSTLAVSEFLCPFRTRSMYDRVSWDPSRVTFAEHGWATVVGADPADLRWPVESVACYRVNTGSPTEYWEVAAKARAVNPAALDGVGWSGYERSQGFRSPGGYQARRSEADARAIVAATKAAGVICPADWQRS